MNYLIIARPYNHASMGVVALYTLRDSLRKVGENAEILNFEGDGRTVNWIASADELGTIKRYAEDCCRNGIVVYPEIVQGNPLGARRVVRYLLNKEGVIKGWGMNASPKDFILTHSVSFCDNFNCEIFLPPQIETDIDSMENFVDRGRRKLSLTYAGKGAKLGKQFIPAGSVEVTREWPRSRDQFLLLLGSAKYFISYDPVSSVNMEAAVRGAIPLVFVSENEFVPEDPEFPFFFVGGYVGDRLNIGDLSNYCATVDFDSYRENLIGRLSSLRDVYHEKVEIFVEHSKSHWGGVK